MQYANKNSFIVSDLEVGEFIKKEIPAFQEDGVFSYTRYNGYLTNTRSTTQKFESGLKKDLASRRLFNYLSSSLRGIDQEKSLEQKVAGVEVVFSYVELKEEALAKAVKVSKEEVSAYMAAAENDAKIAAHYELTKSDYKTPEAVKLSYILIKDEAAAKSIRETLTAETFAATAKEKSDDPLSKAKGGDLGFVERGGFSPEVEAKAFAMKPGELSQPFKTELGYVILLTGEKRPAGVKNLEEAKLAVATELYQKEKSQALKKDFLDLSKSGSKGAMSEKLKGADLNWSTDQKFDLAATSLPGIGPSDDIMTKLLSIEKGEMYPNIVSFQGKDFFIRLDSMSEKTKTQDTKVAQNNTGGRGADLLDLVYENEKKALNIQLNQQIITQ